MSKRELKDEEEVPVDEDWIGGDTVVFKHSGRATSTVARRRCREVFCGAPPVRAEARPAQTSKKGRFWRD